MGLRGGGRSDTRERRPPPPKKNPVGLLCAAVGAALAQGSHWTGEGWGLNRRSRRRRRERSS